MKDERAGAALTPLEGANGAYLQGVCEALDEQGIAYEMGQDGDGDGAYSVVRIAHPDAPDGAEVWCVLRSLEEVQAFLRGWRLCNLRIASWGGSPPAVG